jgi:putative nucleotidyltransferase with HDIG domain
MITATVAYAHTTKTQARLVETGPVRVGLLPGRLNERLSGLGRVRLFENDMRDSARIYISTIILAGFTTLMFAMHHVLVGHEMRWLYLAALTCLGSFFPVTLPSLSRSGRGIAITVSDIFVFAAIPFFGTEVAVTIAAIDATLGNFQIRKSIRHFYKHLFNVAQLSVVTFLTGTLFERLNPQHQSQTGAHDVLGLLLAITVCSLFYFLLNSGAVGLAISLASGQPLMKVWKEHFLWTTLTNLPGAAAAAAICINFERTHFLALATIIPIGMILYHAYRMHLNELKSVHKYLNKMNDLFHSTIASLAMAIDAKDTCTYGHIHRVQALALGLARCCGVTDETELEALRAAALLHDVGKLSVPEYILNKPSKLTGSEVYKMRSHVTVGANILATVPFPYPVVPIVKYHHEKWDGTGYPEGIKGTQIPLGARILAVSDCYDALRYDRPYRPRVDREGALHLIMKESGKSFDPEIVKNLAVNIDSLEFESQQSAASESVSPPHPAGTAAAEKTQADGNRCENGDFNSLATSMFDSSHLTQLAQTLTLELGIHETARRTLDTARKHIHCDAAAIFLVHTTSEKLIPIHCTGFGSEQLQQTVLRPGEGVTGWVAANNQSILNGAANGDFPGAPKLASCLKTALATPLFTERGVIGVITLYSSTHNLFDPECLRYLHILSFYSALAINNAILRERFTPEFSPSDIPFPAEHSVNKFTIEA